MMSDNSGQAEIRTRLADATRDELLEIVIGYAGSSASRVDWWPHYFAADHRCRRLEQLLASRYHTEGLDRALHVADLEANNRKLREEVREMQLAAERHNRESFATGLITRCTGCEAGAPFGAEELTEERVRAVECIARRLREWWNNHTARLRRAGNEA